MNRIRKRPISQPIAFLLTLMLSGCNLSFEQEFRFRGIYTALKSGYQLEVI